MELIAAAADEEGWRKKGCCVSVFVMSDAALEREEVRWEVQRECVEVQEGEEGEARSESLPDARAPRRCQRTRPARPPSLDGGAVLL